MKKNAFCGGGGAEPPSTPIKQTKRFGAEKKGFFFNPSRQISTRPQCVLPVLKTSGRVSAYMPAMTPTYEYDRSKLTEKRMIILTTYGYFLTYTVRGFAKLKKIQKSQQNWIELKKKEKQSFHKKSLDGLG